MSSELIRIDGNWKFVEDGNWKFVEDVSVLNIHKFLFSVVLNNQKECDKKNATSSNNNDLRNLCSICMSFSFIMIAAFMYLTFSHIYKMGGCCSRASISRFLTDEKTFLPSLPPSVRQKERRREGKTNKVNGAYDAYWIVTFSRRAKHATLQGEPRFGVKWFTRGHLEAAVASRGHIEQVAWL